MSAPPKSYTTALSHLCGSSCGSLRFYKYFCRRKAAVVLWKVAGSVRFDCSRYGSFTIFSVCLRFPAVICGCITTENRRLNSISVCLVIKHNARPAEVLEKESLKMTPEQLNGWCRYDIIRQCTPEMTCFLLLSTS